MQYNYRCGVIFTVALAMTLAMFQFWPFLLIFLILGTVATFVISAITGYMINFFLVLIIQFVLMVAIIYATALFQVKRGKKAP